MSEIKRIKAQMKYKLRGDTAENWSNINPILAIREPALVIDSNGKTTGFKIGDGVTFWNDLDFHNIDDNGGRSIDPAVLQNKIELWQPNTEYKVGDTVMAFHSPGLSNGNAPVKVTFIAKCRTQHTSSDDFGVDLNTLIVWDVDILNAYSAIYDSSGRLIEETYATKEEVGNIETALDNIILLQNSLIGGGSV